MASSLVNLSPLNRGSQRHVEMTKGVSLPNFITDMSITTKKWFVLQVFRTNVSDSAPQSTTVHIAAPKALVFHLIGLDEKRIDARPRRSVVTPEFIRRDCH